MDCKEYKVLRSVESGVLYTQAHLRILSCNLSLSFEGILRIWGLKKGEEHTECEEEC